VGNFLISDLKEHELNMKWKITNPRVCLYLIAAIILPVGLGSAILIYLKAENVSDNVMIDEFLNSKKYIHELKAYGGNATVLADEFSRWFDGLWHGQDACFLSSLYYHFFILWLFLGGLSFPSRF